MSTASPVLAQSSIELFAPTQVSKTCDNPASGDFYGNCGAANDFGKLWTFAQKEITLRCEPGDIANLTADDDPNDDGTGVIVDNIMYVNDVDVCNRGDGGTPVSGGDPDGNCFSAGSSATVGVPIQDTFNGIGTIALRGHATEPDVIPDGISYPVFRLTDWGAVYGNSRVVLVTTCDIDGDQGCTPGYWKNHLDSWVPTGYTPDDIVDDVFSSASSIGDVSGSSLLDALAFKGGKGIEGGARILLRAAVAALLDASHPDVFYPTGPDAIIDAVNAALDSADRTTMLDLAESLDYDNNLGCPLN